MDATGVTRKVASARKRAGDRKAKTPKKRKYADVDFDKGSTNSLGAVSEKEPIVCAETWIQNSFMSHNSNVIDKDCQFTLKKKQKCHVSSSGLNTFESNIVCDSWSNQHGCKPTTAYSCSSPRKGAMSRKDGIFSCVTSTPKDRIKNQLKIMPTSPEPYTSQHDSFNESDSLFADIDISSLEKNCQPSCPSRKTACSKVEKVKQERDVLHGLCKQDRSIEMSPNSCASSCGIAAEEVVLLGKSVNHMSALETSGFESDADFLALMDNVEENANLPLAIEVQEHSKTAKQCSTVTNTGRSSKSVIDNSNRQLHEKFISADPLATITDSQLQCHKGNRNTRACNAYNANDGQDKSTVSDPHFPPAGQIHESVPVNMSNNFDSGIATSVTSHSAGLTTPVSGKTAQGQITPATGSIRDKIKRALARNAKAITPQISRIQQLRAESLKEAVKEAEKMQEQGSEFDIGPFFGLPSKVKELLESQRGIKKLYEWQEECLSLPAVREGHNLIYSLPTSGGKTLVAEVLILRQLLCKKKDCLLILPFVAIVQEKVKTLSPFAVELDFLVEEYAASKGAFPPRKRHSRKSLYIATIEKAHSLVNSLIEHSRLENIGLVVIDELHMLGEGGSRGASLEMTLTKVMHVSGNTQLVGMSATLNNIKDLSSFLHAEVYSNDFRPVELKEYVKMEDTLYQINSRALCPDDRLQHSRVLMFKCDRERMKHDPDHLTGLVLEVVPAFSCLIFCPTKKNCENVAELLCRQFPRDLTEVKKAERKSLLKTLWHDGNGQVCPVLRRTVPYGVAYHHSGLTTDERKLIEEAYTEGVLCLLACTSTLAAGVNLPAKRVILRSPYVGASFLSRSQYKQMVGRAGRAGIDSSGESIMVLQKKDKLKLMELVSGPYDFCRSSLLYEDCKGMRALLLTAIGLNVTPTATSVIEFLKRTLQYIQRQESDENITELSRTALQQLINLKLITQKYPKEDDQPKDTPSLEVTKLGRAVFKGPIDVDRGGELYEDLKQAQKSLVVSNHFHLLYLVTPYDMANQVSPRWMTYLEEIGSLDDASLKVTTIVGVSESYIMKKASGQRIKKAVSEQVVGRLYLALVLYRLWRQETVWAVADRFQLPRGFIQNLLTGAASFASCVLHFCQELEEFWAYQKLLDDFVKRLSYCVSMELIPLMEIAGVKQGRARQLYHAGYKTLQQVSHVNPEDLVKQIEHMSKRAARQIVASAQMLLQEKAESLLDEANEMVTMPSDIPSAPVAEALPVDSQDSIFAASSQGTEKIDTT